jgi:hypothetical protein
LQLLRCVAAHCNFLHFTAQLAKWLKIKHLARTTFLRWRLQLFTLRKLWQQQRSSTKQAKWLKAKQLQLFCASAKVSTALALLAAAAQCAAANTTHNTHNTQKQCKHYSKNNLCVL